MKLAKISENGVKFIASFEGCKLTAYWDKTGKVWTIGYGHTRGVKQGDKITKEQALNFLREDCENAVSTVNKVCVNNPKNYGRLTQNQFDALVSFTFNCGVGNLNKLTDNGKRDIKTVAQKIKLYNKSGGVVLAGLTRRREAESQLLLK